MIINADSMQVYARSPDPDGAAECGGEGAGAASCSTAMSACANFIRWAAMRADARERWPRRKPWASVPVFVGGTGLYFMALGEAGRYPAHTRR